MGVEKTAHKVVIEFYAGYRGEEEPHRVILHNRRLPIEKIWARKRVLDSGTGRVSEEFHCLIDGREAELTISESGEQVVTFKT